MAFGIDDIIATGMKILDKFIPDPEMKAKAAIEMRQAMVPVIMAQIELNKAEVQSGHWLGKWRGALGWVLAGSLAYQLVLHPFMVAIILIFDEQFPVDKLPLLDWKQLGSVLLGMLGLGG